MSYFVNPNIMSGPEVAKMLQVSGYTVANWTKTGMIRHHTFPTGCKRPRRRYLRTDVIDFARKHEIPLNS